MRCENYLLNCRLSFLERLWLADAYKLERLLCRCISELLPTEKPDLSGPRYHGLSDRVKVRSDSSLSFNPDLNNTFS